MRALFCALTVGLAAFASLSVAEDAAVAEEKEVPAALKFKVKDIEGEEVDLAKYQGKVLLIVNVASFCGATKQYEDLQALHEKYAEKGLAVLGFPCNQFGGQEPGDEKAIKTFCTSKYDVAFDMFSKVDVNEDDAAPLYKHLTSEEAFADDPGPVKWNFEKFLVGRDGAVKARYRTKVKPTEDAVIEAIESALKEEAPKGDS